MARLRPARTCRNVNSQAWARFSLRKPRKNFIRARPHTSIQVFNTGTRKNDYTLTLTLNAEDKVQLRSNALEAARIMANKFLETNAPTNYQLRLCVYPHNVIREHKMMAGAGADRLSRGMSMAFGRPTSVAARVQRNQAVFMVKTMAENRGVAAEALRRAASKLSGKYRVKGA
jgi:large subunit ribosomal protein L10e